MRVCPSHRNLCAVFVLLTRTFGGDFEVVHGSHVIRVTIRGPIRVGHESYPIITPDNMKYHPEFTPSDTSARCAYGSYTAQFLEDAPIGGAEKSPGTPGPKVVPLSLIHI